jgi:hypothetical protein
MIPAKAGGDGWHDCLDISSRACGQFGIEAFRLPLI